MIAVPAKDPALAKARLGPAIPPPQRRAIALRLLDGVLAALADVRESIEGVEVAVVTESAEIGARARAIGFGVLRAPAGADGGPGQRAAVSLAAAAARVRGFDRLLALPADLADPDPAEIASLLALDLPPPSVVLVPSRDGGTNALLAAPPEAIAFRFGADSLAAHLDEARARGVRAEVVRLRRLAVDIDTPEDLRRAGLLEAVPA